MQKGYIKQQYRLHCSVCQEKAIGYEAFRSRLLKRPDLKSAIETPSKGKGGPRNMLSNDTLDLYNKFVAKHGFIRKGAFCIKLRQYGFKHIIDNPHLKGQVTYAKRYKEYCKEWTFKAVSFCSFIYRCKSWGKERAMDTPHKDFINEPADEII